MEVLLIQTLVDKRNIGSDLFLKARFLVRVHIHFKQDTSLLRLVVSSDAKIKPAIRSKGVCGV
jgi:hypothetical protein